MDFARVFEAEYPRVFRVLDRLSGDPDLAADLVQEAFVRLHRRGSMPDAPGAWLVTVALNLFRNAAASRKRHRRLLSVFRAERSMADPPRQPDQEAVATDEARRVRAALDRLDERDRQLLLLHAGAYSYREIAGALNLNEASIGTLVTRARNRLASMLEAPQDE